MKKKITVGCGIVRKKDKILISQRRPGDSFAGFWEFPGGKVNKNEALGHCVERELLEELGVRVKARKFFVEVFHEYPDRLVHLNFYICDWVSGDVVKHEAHDFAWARIGELKNYNFLPADTDLINYMKANQRAVFHPYD